VLFGLAAILAVDELEFWIGEAAVGNAVAFAD